MPCVSEVPAGAQLEGTTCSDDKKNFFFETWGLAAQFRSNAPTFSRESIGTPARDLAPCHCDRETEVEKPDCFDRRI